MRTTLAAVLVCGSLCSAPLNAQASFFAGASGGISTLSADGWSELAESRPRVSLYKPENGPTFMFFGGRHLNEYLSLQASYGWNRNELTLSATDFPDGAYQFYEQRRAAVQHSFAGEALLYFRNRRSFARPYLSAGGGIVHLSSGEGRIRSVAGSLPAPEGSPPPGPLCGWRWASMCSSERVGRSVTVSARRSGATRSAGSWLRRAGGTWPTSRTCLVL